MRKQGSCLEKEIRQGTMPGARKRGRPHTTWMDNIKTWTGLPVEESIRLREDRDKWRKYVHDVANLRIEDGWRTEQNRSGLLGCHKERGINKVRCHLLQQIDGFPCFMCQSPVLLESEVLSDICLKFYKAMQQHSKCEVEVSVSFLRNLPEKNLKKYIGLQSCKLWQQCRRGTARCVVSVEILPIATQQCRNYLYNKSWTNRSYELGGLRWAYV